MHLPVRMLLRVIGEKENTVTARVIPVLRATNMQGRGGSVSCVAHLFDGVDHVIRTEVQSWVFRQVVEFSVEHSHHF